VRRCTVQVTHLCGHMRPSVLAESGRTAAQVTCALQLWGYVDSLPEHIDLPYFWAPEERAWLACPFLQTKLTTQLDEWPEWYSQLMDASPSCGVTQSDFEHYLACVHSRSFSGPYVASTLKVRTPATPFSLHLSQGRRSLAAVL
jgi:hypothetical protein